MTAIAFILGVATGGILSFIGELMEEIQMKKKQSKTRKLADPIARMDAAVVDRDFAEIMLKSHWPGVVELKDLKESAEREIVAAEAELRKQERT